MDPVLPNLSPVEAWGVLLKALTVFVAVVGVVGGAIGFVLKRVFERRDREAEQRFLKIQASEAKRQQQREVLYESLKWFQGGTQNRSIGIAVVTTGWQAWPEFRDLWIEVLANQAIYLLTGSKQGEKAHEHDNLRRILGLLKRERTLIAKETKKVLFDTIRTKKDGPIAERKDGPKVEGLTLTSTLKELLNESLPAFSDGS